MKKRPIVAFCIPTYNRASFLKASLNTYIINNDFDDDVEIIISDNASTDETQAVGEYYASKYPNIHYFRNDENIRDANFPLALDRATAHYVKLMNDNMPIAPDGIRYIKDCLYELIEKKTPVFFFGVQVRGAKGDNRVVCDSFEEFVVKASRWVTGIPQFGAWKEHWEKVQDPTKYSKMQLSQDDWAYQIVKSEKKIIIFTGSYYLKKMILPKKGGYHWFHVQVENYYAILQPYIDMGLISKKGVKREKETFLHLVMPWIAQVYWLPVFPNWQFETKGTTRILWKFFKDIPFFYLVMLTIPFWGTYLSIKKYIPIMWKCRF